MVDGKSINCIENYLCFLKFMHHRERIMESEQVVKKQKVESEAGYFPNNFAVVPSIRANDIIFFYVKTPFSPELQEGGCPWFTHQIFPDEKLALSVEEFPKGSRINIILNSETMEFRVEVCFSQKVSEAAEQKALSYLRQQMCPVAVPEETVFVVSSSIQYHVSSDSVKPVGNIIHEFSSPMNRNTKFCAHLTSHRENPIDAGKLLSKLEKLAMWYIETASSVDFSEDKWEMIVLYEVGELESSKIFSIAGYLTLYTFHNPFLGSKIRICQALIMPQYQGQGLGRMLLRSAYDLALARNHIVEITVEDPCEAFQNLRDQMDLEYYLERFQQIEDIDSSKNITLNLLKGDIPPKDKPPSTGFVFQPFATAPNTAKVPPATDVSTKTNAIAKALKIIPQQAAFVYEAREFFRLLRLTLEANSIDHVQHLQTLLHNKFANLKRKNSSTSSSVCARNEFFSLWSDEDRVVIDDALDAVVREEYKQFRLQVKRTLLRFDTEGIKDLPKPEMQKALSELFDERIDRYFKLWSLVKRLQLLL